MLSRSVGQGAPVLRRRASPADVTGLVPPCENGLTDKGSPNRQPAGSLSVVLAQPLTGRALIVKVAYWLRSPRSTWARLRYWVWEKMNPEMPWLSPGAVAYCAAALTKSMRALEFGSGR